MGLEAILEVIAQAGERRVEAAAADTEQQVGQVLEQARREAARARERACTERAARAADVCGRRVEEARVQAIRLVGGERERLIDEVMDRVFAALREARADPAYAGTLRRLAGEALDALRPLLADGEQPLVRADPRDRATLDAVLNALGAESPAQYDLSCAGGVVAASADGRIVVDNTLEARFERARSFLRWRLAAWIEARERARTGALPDQYERL